MPHDILKLVRFLKKPLRLHVESADHLILILQVLTQFLLNLLADLVLDLFIALYLVQSTIVQLEARGVLEAPNLLYLLEHVKDRLLLNVGSQDVLLLGLRKHVDALEGLGELNRVVVEDEILLLILGRGVLSEILPGFIDEVVGVIMRDLNGSRLMVDLNLLLPLERVLFRVELGSEDRVLLGFDGGDKRTALFIIVVGGDVEEGSKVLVGIEFSGRHAIQMVKVHRLFFVEIELHVVAHLKVELGFLV